MTHEERYVDEVRRELADVPGRQRGEIVGVVASDLAERPEAEAWEQLLAELGAPDEYAAALRVEHGLAVSQRGRAGRRAVPRAAWVVGGLVAVVAIGAVAHWRWTSADPGIVNSCAGVAADEAVELETRVAAGVTERRIGYVDGATVGLGLCLSSAQEVEVLDVRLDAPPVSLFRPEVVRAADAQVEPEGTDPVLVPTALRDGRMLRIAIEGRLADCEQFGEGVGLSFATAEVSYRYRGRTRTTTVDLVDTYTFVAPPPRGCPRGPAG